MISIRVKRGLVGAAVLQNESRENILLELYLRIASFLLFHPLYLATWNSLAGAVTTRLSLSRAHERDQQFYVESEPEWV